MDDGESAPGLEVGFAINFGDGLGQLRSLDDILGETAANAVREFKKMEVASQGSIKLAGATADMVAFGNAATRELEAVRQAQIRAEKSGEGMVRQLERQIEVYGKTASEIRNMRAEQRALAAEQTGNTDLAARVRALNAEMVRLEAGSGRAGASLGGTRSAMQGLSFQAQDAFTQISMGTNALSVLAIQGGQAAGQMANMGGKLGAVANFLIGPWGLAITGGLLVLGALTKGLFDNEDAAKKAEAAMKKFQDRQSDIGNFIDDTTGRLKEQNKTLVINAILTRQAQMAANDKAISEQRTEAFRIARTTRDRNPPLAGVSSAGSPIYSQLTDPRVAALIKQANGDVGKLTEGLAGLAKQSGDKRYGDLALRISGMAGEAIIASRENAKLGKELRALNGDTTALANGTTNLINKQVAFANATTPLEKARAQLALVQETAAAADKAGGAALVTYRKNLDSATKAVNSAEAAQKAATAAKRDATSAARHAASEAQAEENQAERLAREVAAIQAQTRNLYALADAYGVSGAAALVAEARVKAESMAIKQQADVEAAVARQVELTIAQRVSDAARSTAAMRDQAAAQEQINAMVAAGLVPAERADELVRNRIADLPLLAALEAAQQVKSVEGITAATKALLDQAKARARVTAASRGAQFNDAMAAGDNRLAELREELRLVGATDAARAHALATIRATREAATMFTGDPAKQARFVEQQVKIADETQRVAAATRDLNEALNFTADKWDLIAGNVQNAGQGMSDAFGNVGRAIGDMASAYADYRAQEEHAAVIHKQNMKDALDDAARQREMAKYNLATSTAQVGMYGDLAASAKGFFREGTTGYQTMQKAEQVFRAVQFALSIRAMAQNAAETVSSIAKSGLRTAAHAVEAVVKAIASLPFPLNIAAGAATAAVIASLGVSLAGSFGSGSKPTPANEGTGTVLGDTAAKSESLKRSIDALKEVDTVTSVYAREMSSSLKSIDSQIGNLATVLVRAGDINASSGVKTGFKMDTTGKLLQGLFSGGGLFNGIPILGDILGGIGSLLGSLFGSTTKVTGNGIYGGPQSVGSIVSGGFAGQSYSDIEKTKKFLGITTGHSYSTQYGALDPALSGQFTLILRSFNDAIKAAAGPLGENTDAIQARLNSFVVNIGKIDLKGLTGEQIQDKLTAIFGAAADNMANAAFPGIAAFQKAGEGAFETLVRVASTVEAVSSSLDVLGQSAQGMSVAAKLALADQFDSVSALTSAADAYFQAFYSKEEQTAARTTQMTKVFSSLGLQMPATLAAFRQLVEAQDLTTSAGQATYATLLQMAPAFADLQGSLAGVKSAADIASERLDLQRQLLELQGDTAAIRALDLAKLDESNRALQLQIWAIQDAQAAAKAADELRQAWVSVGDSIMDEVQRIRGLSGTQTGSNFASLLGQFNAANAAARGGDMDAAKTLPALSQALLSAAALAATSQQELARVQAQAAASLEATNAAIRGLSTSAEASDAALLAASGAAQDTSTATTNDNTVDLRSALVALTDKVEQMRADNNAGHAATAANTGKAARVLDNVTAASGGDAVTIIQSVEAA